MKNNNLPRWIGAICRTLLGLTFIFSGFVKAVDPLGTVYKIEDYLNAFGGIFTDMVPLAPVAAVVLIAFEFVLGVLLTLNVWTKVTSWLALVMMLVMTPLTLYLAIANPVTDCGCFGDAIHLSNWATFGKNVVLLLLVVVLLLITQRNLFQTWVKEMNIIIFCVALAIVSGLMAYSLLHLPPLDFRPYKIGNNIPEQMVVDIPEDAPMDEYEYTFVYEKDGVQQEFTLDNYPKDDTSWVFVEQHSKLVKKGYEAPEPPVHDFVLTLTDESGDMYDMTDEILEADSLVLAVMHKVEQADKKQAAKLNRLWEECIEAGVPFYALTGSGEREVDVWVQETGAEYPFLSCDGVTLKTIVRANPGVVVLRNGTVVDKYNMRNRKF